MPIDTGSEPSFISIRPSRRGVKGPCFRMVQALVDTPTMYCQPAYSTFMEAWRSPRSTRSGVRGNSWNQTPVAS